MADTVPDTHLDELLDYVRETRGFDFTGYKRPSLTRRIQKRMQTFGLDGDFSAYQAILEAEPDEFAQLFDTVLINVTGFMRDAAAWEYIGREVIPRIIEPKKDGDPIRVWSAACASGEEVYSLAILLCDALGEGRFRDGVKVYGTDADEQALAQARQGRYPAKAVRGELDGAHVERYFEVEDGALVFRKDLRRSVIFGRHDLVQDPPISRVDLLVCRNTLMYFNADTQRRILSSLHFALNDGGYLFLGKSEALVTRSNLFSMVDGTHHVFAKRNGRSTERPPLPARFGAPLSQRDGGRDLLGATFEASPVAQVVIDRHGRVELANRHARSVFGLGIGDVGRPFHDLELSYRPIELRSRIEQVFADRRPVTVSDVQVELPGGATDYLEIQLLPVEGVHGTGVSLTFTEVGRHKLLREELERSQRELETSYEELRSTVEELETTNEELQSTNEELETTNEELHSTNEELETMNEELQSTNEELETMNAEFRQRSSELDEANAFFGAVLTSLGAGVAVLNQEMAVRVWNRQAEDLWGVRPEEVQGHHFLNLDIGLPVDRLRDPIRAALTGRTASERVVLAAVNRRGRTIQCQVTVSPLMRVDGGLDGVIVRMDEAVDNEGRNGGP